MVPWGTLGWIMKGSEDHKQGFPCRPKGSHRLVLDILRDFSELWGGKGRDNETWGEKPTRNIPLPLREFENVKSISLMQSQLDNGNHYVHCVTIIAWLDLGSNPLTREVKVRTERGL